MKVRILTRTHMLLLLTAREAQSLGIPTSSGCAMILRTHSLFYPHLFQQKQRYHVRLMPQIFRLHSCEDLFRLLLRLRQIPKLSPLLLYGRDGCYDLVLFPSCRSFFLLRTICSEYGTLWSNSPLHIDFLQEHSKLLSRDAINEIGQFL